MRIIIEKKNFSMTNVYEWDIISNEIFRKHLPEINHNNKSSFFFIIINKLF